MTRMESLMILMGKRYVNHCPFLTSNEGGEKEVRQWLTKEDMGKVAFKRDST